MFRHPERELKGEQSWEEVRVSGKGDLGRREERMAFCFGLT